MAAGMGLAMLVLAAAYMPAAGIEPDPPTGTTAQAGGARQAGLDAAPALGHGVAGNADDVLSVNDVASFAVPSERDEGADLPAAWAAWSHFSPAPALTLGVEPAQPQSLISRPITRVLIALGALTLLLPRRRW